MDEGKRPGGLTALAVINFVFCGLSMMSVLGMVALFAFMDKVPTDNMTAQQKAQMEAVQNMGMPTLVLLVILNLVTAALLLLSGIGYLQQKKALGRMIGNVYAVVSIVAVIVSALLFRPELGGGFHIGSIIGLVYPVITLVLVNTTFKEDLTN
jgi:predicted small integral membrane protein